MRILLVGNYARDRQESMQRFAQLLKDGLEASGLEVRIIRPQAVFSRLVTEHSRLLKWLGYIDKLILFPRVLRKEAKWGDLVHVCDHSNAMYCRAVEECPVIITCHDMLAVRSALGDFLENPTRWSGRIYQRLILRGLRNARFFACVSNATQTDLKRLVGNKGKFFSVIYNGQNYPYKPMAVKEAAASLIRLGIDKDEKFLLHVGGNQWYKNRLGVLEIYRHLLEHNECSHLRLVLVGKPWTEAMKTFVREHKLDNRVMELNGLSNHDLQALYSSAKGLLFPSLHEGFGWPVIESQACGCAVFTTNRAPMTEIGGDNAVYIDPEKPQEAAGRIATALTFNESGGEAAIRNAARFSDKIMIDGYILLYHDVLSGDLDMHVPTGPA